MPSNRELLDPSRMPRHVGIIMDGNGRWATERRYPRVYGHRNAVKAVRATVEAAVELELEVLTLYAFSTENWRRPAHEVSTLMDLFAEYLQKELKTMLDNNVLFQVAGESQGLPQFLQQPLNHALESTSENTGLLLNLAVNYGGRAELVRAVKKISSLVQSGNLNLEEINEDLISEHTFTPGIPDPDLIIRTSGEKRLSNFLIWQAAYSEYFFTDVLWPDFDKEDFFQALLEFQKRNRRLGRTEPLKETA